MERGPLLEILRDMKGTAKELDLLMLGESQPVELRNIVDVMPMKDSGSGLMIMTKQNYIWLECNHVSACYQARADLP